MKKSMVIYRNWVSSLNEIDDPETYKRIAQAIFSYGLDGDEPDLKGADKVIFQMMRDKLDEDREKWKAKSEKMSENGKKGNEKRWGNRKSDNNIAEATEKSQIVAVNVNVNDNVNVYIYKYIYSCKLASEVKDALIRFVDHRSQKQTPVTEESIKQIVSDLVKLSLKPEEQVAIINQSIQRGWSGLFALDSKPKHRKNGFNNFRGREIDFEELERVWSG